MVFPRSFSWEVSQVPEGEKAEVGGKTPAETR